MALNRPLPIRNEKERVDGLPHSLNFEQIDAMPGQEPLDARCVHTRMHVVGHGGVMSHHDAVGIRVARGIDELGDDVPEPIPFCYGHCGSSFSNCHILNSRQRRPLQYGTFETADHIGLEVNSGVVIP